MPSRWNMDVSLYGRCNRIFLDGLRRQTALLLKLVLETFIDSPAAPLRVKQSFSPRINAMEAAPTFNSRKIVGGAVQPSTGYNSFQLSHCNHLCNTIKHARTYIWAPLTKSSRMVWHLWVAFFETTLLIAIVFMLVSPVGLKYAPAWKRDAYCFQQ